MTIDMTRHQGDTCIALIECTDTRLQKYRVRTDIQPSYDEDSEEQRGVSFIEHEFPYRPTVQEVREFVFAVINDQTRQKIISGFTWQEQPVWLSVENQLNFAQGVAPVTFKIGELSDGTPLYHEFATAKELTAFWKECAQWRQQCLDEGNRRKESFDFTPYEEELKIED